jgi:hypothetical protein
MWRNPGFLRRLPPPQAADLSGLVLWRASIAGQADQRPDFAACLMADGVAPSFEIRAEFSGEKFFVGYNAAASLALSVERFAGFAVQKTNCCGRVINSGGALAPGSNPVQFAFQP